MGPAALAEYCLVLASHKAVSLFNRLMWPAALVNYCLVRTCPRAVRGHKCQTLTGIDVIYFDLERRSFNLSFRRAEY